MLNNSGENKEARTKKSIKNKLVSVFQSEFSVGIILILVILVAACFTDRFLTVSNAINILQRSTVVGIIAVGMTFVILSGGIDLSVGGQLILIGNLGAMFMVTKTLDFNVCLLIMLVIGCILGAINGFGVGYLRLPPFILTLALMNITKGFSLYLTQGKTIFNLPEQISIFGLSKTLGVHNSIWIFVIFCFLGYIFLKYTPFGRHIYAVGDNEHVAWIAGVKTRKVLFFIYVIQGFLVAIASIILVSRIQSATGSMATGIELDAIAGVVIGGTSLMGGEGDLIGTIIGIIIISIISNAMNLIGISPFLQDMVKGIIILFAVIADMWRKNLLLRRV